jgi:hypothetical protein
MSVATVVAGHTQGLSGAARCSPTPVAPLDPTRARRGCRSCGSAATAYIWQSVPERDTFMLRSVIVAGYQITIRIRRSARLLAGSLIAQARHITAHSECHPACRDGRPPVRLTRTLATSLTDCGRLGAGAAELGNPSESRTRVTPSRCRVARRKLGVPRRSGPACAGGARSTPPSARRGRSAAALRPGCRIGS